VSLPRLLVVLLAVSCIGFVTSPATAQSQAAWEQWQHQVGIVDMAVRGDGTLVAMIAGHLFLISPASGAASPFANGPDGFSADPTAEPYFVVTPDLSVGGGRCAWHSNELYVLDLTSPPGIARVDTAGHASRLATLNGVDTLGGIALDTTGRFDHQLVVTGTHNGDQTTVFSVACDGASTVVTDSAPIVEGGLAVAPMSFGSFGGDLIAPDENSGQIWAIAPSGAVSLVVKSGLPSGGDTGVESEGFVPAGFMANPAGSAYLADRGTADNPFPGTDSILRLSAAALAAAGIQDGDLLVATEGNGTTIAVRCTEACAILPAAQGTNGGHIEGHIAVTPPNP
jgi:hypothetical protein